MTPHTARAGWMPLRSTGYDPASQPKHANDRPITAIRGVCTVVLVLHMPSVSSTAKLAQTMDGADVRALGGNLFHPAVGLVVLLAITALNVYKPAGLTPYGWRKQRGERNELQRSARRALSTAVPVPGQ
jgi:hypothetical protein